MARRFYLKVHEVMYNGVKEYLVAVCDEELLGKQFEDSKFRISVNPRFYGGELVDAQRVIEELKKATIANLVGDEAVKLAIREKLVSEDNVIKVGKILHAQFVALRE